MFTITTHTVSEPQEKVRLYDYCNRMFNDYIPSHKGIKKALKRGEFYVDNKIGKSGDWVKEGQTIELRDLELTPPKPYPMELKVIFEDDFLAIIHKPAGISVSGNQYRTIQNAIIHQVNPSSQQDALKWPRPVHRLDNPTSGLLVIAKTANAIIRLSHQFKERKVSKTYTAIVMGIPLEQGKINTPINGQQAHTTYKRLEHINSLRSTSLALLQLHPHTGRTHQLRIHCAESGFPILGDVQYGPKGGTLLHKGLFLCATELSLRHPMTNELISFHIDPPDKFCIQMKREARRWKKFNDGV